MKRFSYLLLCLACFAVLALGACGKDEPKNPDNTEKPDDDPVGPDDPISGSNNPFEEGWNDYDHVVTWPEDAADAFVGTWVALKPDLSMLRLDLRPSAKLVLVESEDINSLLDLKVVAGTYDISGESREIRCSLPWGGNSSDHWNMTISVKKFLPMQFQAYISYGEYQSTLTFHKIDSSILIERDDALQLPSDIQYSGDPVSLNPQVCSVDNLTVKCEDYGVSYVTMPTQDGKAYSEVIVSSLIELPVDRARTFVSDLVDMSTLGSLITDAGGITIDAFPEKYDGLMRKVSIYESGSDADSRTYTVDMTYRYSSIPDLAMWMLLNEKYDFKKSVGRDYVCFDYKPVPITKSIFDNNNVNWYPRTGHIVYEKAFTLKM